MEFLIRVLIPGIRMLLLSIQAGNTTLQILIRRLAAWHRRQMATDPAYPTILAVIAAGIFRITIRNKTQAAILAAMVAKALGLHIPDQQDWIPPNDYD